MDAEQIKFTATIAGDIWNVDVSINLGGEITEIEIIERNGTGVNCFSDVTELKIFARDLKAIADKSEALEGVLKKL